MPSKKHEEIEPKKRKQKAFTLMEMVVVVAIIAVLVLLISPNLWAQKESATKKADEAFMTTLQTQVELLCAVVAEVETGKRRTDISFIFFKLCMGS